jgi:hypothetical protein
MALVASFLMGAAIAAPPSAPPALDHFRCYSIAVGHPTGLPVDLQDQFDSRLDKVEEVIVGLPIGFCNPVAKTVPGPGQGPGQTTDIRDISHHLTLYEIHETANQRHLTWKLTVDNQFGRQTVFVSRPVLLAVPTQKVTVGGEGTGHAMPEGLNHFKCYRARGRDLNVAVTLEDQFETAEVIVGEPLFFCNPTTKVVSRSEVTPIEDAEAHVACYEIGLAAPVGFTTQLNVGTVNQFNHIPVEPLTVVTDERVLCVPSNKTSVLGMPGSFKQAP